MRYEMKKMKNLQFLGFDWLKAANLFISSCVLIQVNWCHVLINERVVEEGSDMTIPYAFNKCLSNSKKGQNLK